jgi:hypothetical protein
MDWCDWSPLLEAAQSTAFDPVLKALSACLHLQEVFIMTKFASGDAIRNLLQLPANTALTLALTPEQLLAVADEIRLGRSHRKELSLWMVHSTHSKATEAVKAVASAIQLDCKLEDLYLQMKDGFTDEAGVALAEAVTINKTPRWLMLGDNLFGSDPVCIAQASLGAQAYEAFSAMLRVNTSLNLHVPAFDADEREIVHLTEWLRVNTSID